MPQRTPISLGKNSYESISRPFAVQRCINLYVAGAQAEALSDFMLYGTPGVSGFSDVGGFPSRGAIVMDGVYYVVSGETLYTVDENGNASSLGTVLGTARVVMAHNGEKLCIVVPGGNGYVYNATTITFTQITDPDYRTSDTVCFKDGYYVFTETDSNVFFISNLNDPLTFDPLDFGTAEQSPGNIIACHATYDEVVIFKRDYAERFQNVGGAGFPFQRIPGASFEKGARSRYSPIQWEGRFYFIGGGRNQRPEIFQAAPSGEPVKISTDAISTEIQKFTETEIAAAFAFSYSVNGVSFVGFTFASVNIDSKTFVYNITASRIFGRQVWHEQQSGVSDNRWRVASVDFVYNRFVVSDSIDGRIGVLDDTVYTEYDDVLIREKALPPITARGADIFISLLEFTMESGVGTISGQGEDPEVALDWSDTGGRLWSSEIKRKFGKIGEYNRKVFFRRLGHTPSFRTFRVRVTDPVPVAFIKAEMEIVIGR